MWKQKIRRSFARHANNWRGKKMNRKIVVIESDDWGSICMPSREVYEELLNKGIRVDRCNYARYDSLASKMDLESLFSVLSEFRDHRGRHPVVTANCVTANPDFEKIRESEFSEYHYEPFIDTLQRYPESSHKGVFDTWRKGIDENLFYPQFHGREHIHIKAWLNVLQDLNSDYRSVFDDEICWLGPSYNGSDGSLRAAFEADQMSELDLHRKIIQEGLHLFEEIFGYRSESFIAPNFISHPELDRTLYDEGVSYIQGMKYRKLPFLGKNRRTMVRRIQGGTNDLGQTNLVRNCVFEPSLHSENYDNIGTCLKDIQNAFLWKKPAVITAHRLNFIGHIFPENRKKNLTQLRELLSRMLKEWPDIEFMTSVELGRLMQE